MITTNGFVPCYSFSKTNGDIDLGISLQKHIDANADITVSCLPMDDRYIYLHEISACMLSFYLYIEGIPLYLLEAELVQTIISLYVSCSRASDYGLMKIDETGRIIQFAEKPKGSDLKAMVH
jgi:ADP-glucose pyrophosphorylase